MLAGLWMGPDTPMAAAGNAMQLAATLWMLLFGMLAIHAFLDALVDVYNTLPFARQLPIRSFVQVVKLVTVLVFLIITISMLLGKSPALLISGMGAMTAVLMLVFKDPILGFVAGIQLSANRMLAVGDWLEMPKHNADGDVIEVTLTTVKVRNWDQTITTIPTYALIADSFKNWRGMSEAGGRRIKRSVFIDMTSVRFLNPDDIERLRKAQLLTAYITDKIADIERYNREHGIDPASPVNGRRLTNIGTFRAYLSAYLKFHPGIHQNLIMMVRQLQPTAEGLPIEIYAFTSDTGWVAHEGVQSDIFDHILAIIPEFGLRVFQSPTGSDIRSLVAERRER
jgi:miniconductance mechanosensitive channel